MAELAFTSYNIIESWLEWYSDAKQRLKCERVTDADSPCKNAPIKRVDLIETKERHE